MIFLIEKDAYDEGAANRFALSVEELGHEFRTIKYISSGVDYSVIDDVKEEAGCDMRLIIKSMAYIAEREFENEKS